MSYTRGPWKVKETKDGMTTRANRKRLEIVAPCPGGGEMVIVGKHTGLDCLQSDNARLIAAAPDLLCAMQELFEQCAMIHRYGGDACNQKEADAAIKAGLAAIAKATGGEVTQ